MGARTESMDNQGTAGIPAPPVVEQGYQAGGLLGSGRTAAVWLTQREGDGARFALKIPAVAAGGPGTTFETRRELNILTRYEHVNLLRLHTVLETDQGPGLLMEWAAGGSFARLSRARGTLSPGETVTVLVGIASALDYLHGLNVSHSDVSPGNILFTANGKPLLADLGTARLFGTGTGISAAPEEDIFALAAVGWLALTGRALPPAERRLPLAALVPEIPEALAEAVDAGLQEDPGLRPNAAEFSRLVYASAAAQPLDLALPEAAAALPGPQTRRARRDSHQAAGRVWKQSVRLRREPDAERPRASRRQPSPLVLAGAAVLVAATMGLGAVAVAAPEILQGGGRESASGKENTKGESGASGNPAPAGDGAQAQTEAGVGEQQAPEAAPVPANAPAPGTSPPQPGPMSLAPAHDQDLQQMVRGEDPVQAARALAELRARAFSAADREQLNSVNAPRSPAMETDQEEIGKLKASGTVLSGLGVEIVPAEPARPGPEGRVSVRAGVSTSAYEERDAGGGVVRNVAAVPTQDVVLVLLRSPDGWRIEDVLAPPA